MADGPILKSGSVTPIWAAQFSLEPDGWRFLGWQSTQVAGEDAAQPYIQPEHLTMRFPSFEEAIEFFRARYGSTAVARTDE